MQHPPKKRAKRRPRPHLVLILTGVGVVLAAAALFFLLPAIRERFPAEPVLPVETGPESRTLYVGDSSQVRCGSEFRQFRSGTSTGRQSLRGHRSDGTMGHPGRLFDIEQCNGSHSVVGEGPLAGD